MTIANLRFIKFNLLFGIKTPHCSFSIICYSHIALMKTVKIVTASNLAHLKSLGTFYKIKINLEQTIGNKIGVRGWDSLYKKIEHIKKTVRSENAHLREISATQPFNKAREELSKILGIKIRARNGAELISQINTITDTFSTESFDPYAYYEKIKLQRFITSSKLEGIHIDTSDGKTSLETVISKYKR